MSLLLDALKKAAEQKAEKSKEDQLESSSPDETLIHADADDTPRRADEGDGSRQPAPRELQDETELDHSEFETHLERTRLDRDDADETALETKDDTDTRIPDLSTQMQTGEDETIIFAEEDVSDFLGEPALIDRSARSAEDETDLSRLVAKEDETDMRRAAPRDDETDLSKLGGQEDETEFLQQFAADDETDLDDRILSEEQTEFRKRVTNEAETKFVEPASSEDETDISIPPAHAADAIDQGYAQVSPSDDTKLGQVEATAKTTDGDAEDLSLYLASREDTNLTARTSITDPQVPGDNLNALSEDTSGDDFALVDTTRHQLPDQPTSTQAATQTSSTATTGVAPDTQTTGGTTQHADSTSTRTYAPDNYDRTLMKLPSEDASRLFAGMKSDSDVVMTPDYAKKVFQSKSSAQRIQHYKLYAVIALAILLGIGVYGLFEMQEEWNNIETSLRPLKRDPMPGVIRPGETKTTLFGAGGTGVDAKTLELVENAQTGSVAKQGVISGVTDGVVGEPVMQPVISQSAGSFAAQSGSGDSVAAVTAGDSTKVAKLDLTPSAAQSDNSAKSTMQISINSRMDEKHVWLREAYAAYQSGNDALALTLYNQVLEVDPSNRNALLARAAINVQNNNSAAAIKDYQALLLANPKDSLAMASLIGVANYSPRDAETQLKLMLREDPVSPYLNFALANAYGAQNRWQEAQGHYFTALENNPRDPNYAYNLAVSLEHIEKPTVAISYYQRALDNFNSGLATFSRDVVDQRLETLRKL